MYKIKQNPEDFKVRERSTVKPGKTGRYSYFLLKKRNYNTLKACQKIADFLRMPLKFIGFAGNKDRNAVTEQVISIKGNAGFENFKDKDIELRHLGFGDAPVSLGDLEGNKFEIVVESSKKPKEKRIINYFGEQRFSEVNLEVGRDIVKKNFEKACSIIKEESVKKFLEKNKSDFIGALRTLPKKILLLYVHSYQSYIWNKSAEEYLKERNEEINEDAEIPIVGFGAEYSDEKTKKIIKKILAEEGITERDFIIKEIPDASVEGGKRKLFVDIQDFKMEKLDGKCMLKFFLPKGSYATEVVRQLFS